MLYDETLVFEPPVMFAVLDSVYENLGYQISSELSRLLDHVLGTGSVFIFG